MVENSTLIKCLGKSLKTEVKYVSICKFRFYNSMGKEIKYQQDTTPKQILCLGRDNLFLIKGDMQKIIEKISYESFTGLEIETKNNENFSIWLEPSQLNSNSSIKRILIIAKFRAILIKNFLCYYSVYYMFKYFEIRELKVAIKQNSVEDKNQEVKKGLSRIYKQISSKSYE